MLRFELAIVPEEEYVEDEKCPHCYNEEANKHEILTYVQTKGLQGDIIQCHSCKGVYLVFDYPDISLPEPLLTKWTLK